MYFHFYKFCRVILKNKSNKKTQTKRRLGFYYKQVIYIYLIFSTTALKASGLFTAKSAKTLRFSSILLAFTFPIN